jgi:hypothetical protein
MDLLCPDCAAGLHERCQGMVPTGRQVPDRDPYRDRPRMVPEFRPCECACQNVDVPW